MAEHASTAKPAPFRAVFAPDDEALAAALLAEASLPPASERQIDAEATRLIEAIRAGQGGIGGIEQILQEYSLSTKEGLALMVLAEALLRVPDSTTADKLIEDKLGQGNFLEHQPKSDALLINASAWALALARASSSRARRPTAFSRALRSASACPPSAPPRGRPCA